MTEYWQQCEGQVVGGAFRLEKYLGGDGDRAVFLTEYRQPTSQKAAIKIVLGTPENTDAEFSRWGLAAKLSHPNLLRIFSMGRGMLGDQSLVYLVMEYADESLAHVIPVRPLATDEARQMLEPALDALAYLHGQGFVHGHIKPAHIMAVGECLKLSIAGLCRIGECPMQSGDAYTAPEGTASPAADVWSLGVTLVETLTQRLPAQGVPETLPPPFLEIARECLRSDPGGRPAAASLAARLHPDARPVARPRLKWAYALAAAVGLVVSAVVIAPRLIDREEPVQVQATAPPPEPVPKEQAAPAVRPPQNAIIQRVLPEVPAQASRTIRGKVRVSVRVEVDPSGKVTNAKLDSAGPSAYFAQLALQAARRWKFSPANEDTGKSRTWIVHFEFSRSGTKAVLGRMAKAF